MYLINRHCNVRMYVRVCHILYISYIYRYVMYQYGIWQILCTQVGVNYTVEPSRSSFQQKGHQIEVPNATEQKWPTLLCFPFRQHPSQHCHERGELLFLQVRHIFLSQQLVTTSHSRHLSTHNLKHAFQLSLHV